MTKNKSNKNPEDIVVPAKELPIEKHKKDWRHSQHWRVLRIMAEFIDGFQFLGDLKKSVTFFGSARYQEDHHWYKETRKLGNLLAKNGFTVVTGGGPGIMEAANRGALEGGGESVGLNIKLPYEQRINKYVREGVGFHYFFTRKVMLSYAAQAYVFCPGGFGTLDEVFELLTLIQTHKIYEKIPIVFMSKSFWGGLLQWLQTEVLEQQKNIDPEDLKLFQIVDTAEEALIIIKKSKPRQEI